MSDIPVLTLNNGCAMPQLGLGVWQIGNETVGTAVEAAFTAGYRSIDTASMYMNEEGIGRALQNSGLPREQVFITTKLWNTRQAGDEPRRSLEESLQKLKLAYVDLYLIHWPAPPQNLYVHAWRSLVALQKEGLIRSIGVSNFTASHLQRLFDETGVIPAVNQIELHPLLQQKELRAFHARHGIVTESWSPLAQGEVLSHPLLASLAGVYGKTPAQIVIRWHLDNGLAVIPKSAREARIRENADVFDFHLTSEDMAKIAGLDSGRRLGPDPDVFVSL